MSNAIALFKRVDILIMIVTRVSNCEYDRKTTGCTDVDAVQKRHLECECNLEGLESFSCHFLKL